MGGPRMPFTANIGRACYYCLKDEKDATLQKCTMCRMVRYCGTACQKVFSKAISIGDLTCSTQSMHRQEDWSQHKVFCKASHKMESDSSYQSALLSSLADAPFTDFQTLNMIIETIAKNSFQFHELVSKRSLSIAERNLYVYEPRCMACARTDRLMRLEAARNKSSPPNTLKACPDCKTSFYCSDEHRETVRRFHSDEPCEDGHDGLTQCQMNLEARSDIVFVNVMAGAKAGPFYWTPERVKPGWTSLEGTDWKGEFCKELARFFSIPISHSTGVWIRAASNGLSMPMSILWGLENLNTDDSWTRQHTLTVHILGAYESEVTSGHIFEEILHRLPTVQVLKLVLCGPQMAEYPLGGDNTLYMETCRLCARQGRKRLHVHCDKTYHDYAKSLGANFAKPDIAVAFNSGCSIEATSSWKETIAFLKQNNIPSLFTACNREEAEGDTRILQSAGAKLHPALGPCKNKWGSILARCEPSKIIGFYSGNRWLVGGFR